MGGNQTFAAGANQIGQLEESGRSGRRSSFFDLQPQRMAAQSPTCKISMSVQTSAIGVAGACHSADKGANHVA